MKDDVDTCENAQKPPTNADISDEATEEFHLKIQWLHNTSYDWVFTGEKFLNIMQITKYNRCKLNDLQYFEEGYHLQVEQDFW